MTMQYEELGNLISIAKGRKAPKTFTVPVPNAKRYIQINDLRSDEKLMFADDPLGVDVMPSDLCIAWDGANAGTIGFGLSGIIGSTIARLRPKKTNLFFTPYVGRFLKSKFNYLNGGTTGATIPHVSKDKLANLRIPLPPDPEQRRIAAILDKADAVRRKRQESIRLTEEFLRSVFLDMFGDPVTNPKGWKVIQFGELCEELRYGTSIMCSNDRQKDDLPVLRIPNVIGEQINWHELKYAQVTEAERSRLLLQKGDILFVRTNGNPENIGRCAVYEEEKETLYASYLIRARLKKDAPILSHYINSCLSFPTYRGKVVAEAKTTAGNYNINTEGLRNLKIPLPPLNRQKQYVELMAKTAKAHSKLESGLENMDGLFNSLVQRAFRGELQ